MRSISTKKQSGFSLIETLVYMSVLILVVGALITTFLSLDTVLLRNKTDRELVHSASVSMERIVREIRQAHTVDVPMSVLGTSPGALELESPASSTRFYLATSTLMVSVDGVTEGPLTSESVVVEGLVFHRYTGSTTEMVRVALTLSASSKAASSTRTFYTSAVLRGSYE